MSSFIWVTREPPIEYGEWISLIRSRENFHEADEGLVQSRFGNLLHLADMQNHFYWRGHPSGEAVPFSYTQKGLFVGEVDEFTLAEAEAIGKAFGASVSIREV